MQGDDPFTCFLVTKQGKNDIRAGIERRPMRELPSGEVLVRVSYSSLNYKDALASIGHPGVVRNFPHVPGIDAAGEVVESSCPEVKVGQQVIVTSYELGAGQWGGWAEYIRVPSKWVIPLPHGLSLKEAMIYGTAGLTAGLCVDTLIKHHIKPDCGEIVVTGSTGGVGSLAVQILSGLGYRVVAVSGKADRTDWLKRLGAADVVGRDAVDDTSNRPLLTERWAGVVDTVGGTMLTSIIRSTKAGGCVTACGLVGGADLALTVYPFILRGVTLAGIDSAWRKREDRMAIWSHLATNWRARHLVDETIDVPLAQIEPSIASILKGEIAGRVVVKI